MKALVYHGSGHCALEEMPRPCIQSPTGAIVRITKTTICGTDLHILTGYECGVLNGVVKPGDTVAIVGAGPIGLATLITAQFYAPDEIIMVDVDDNRLQVSKELGATQVINNSDGKAVEKIMALTDNRGVDAAIEAVGIPASFDICQRIVAAGGHIANIGLHGNPMQLNLDTLWSRNISINTRLVDTVSRACYALFSCFSSTFVDKNQKKCRF